MSAKPKVLIIVSSFPKPPNLMNLSPWALEQTKELAKLVDCTVDHGGIKDVVNEDYGIFVEKNSPTSVAKGIEKAMKDFSSRSQTAWKTAKDNYSLDQFVNRVREVLSKCSKNKEER